ncbi:MAG: hypothetical protein WC803_12795 [Sphingomonas sp.]|jgi:hypothetical protein
MRNYTGEIARLESQFKEVKSSLKEASKFTQKFLNKCGEAGITGVSVGMKSDKIESTKHYPFECYGSVFQSPSGTRGKDGWVAIWGVVSEMGISGGCGNTDQHQVSNDNLISGVYELKERTWRKVE